MSIFKKVSAFLTATCMAAALAGCSDTTYGLVVDDYTVPAGVYIYYAYSAYNNALSMLAEENEEFDTNDMDAVKAATVEGVDSLTWIQNKATELCVNFVAVEKKFDELGLELDAVTEDEIDSMVEYYWSGYEEAMERNGVGEASFKKIMTSSYKSEMIFDYYFGIDGENGVTEEQLQEFYLENNIRTQYVTFKLLDGAGNLLKSDGKKDMMDMVEDYQERVESAYEEGGVEAVMTEMSVVQDEYNAYCTSISAEAAATATDAAGTTASRVETTATTTEETTEETTTTTVDTTEDTAEAAETDAQGNAVTAETTTTVEAEETVETTTTTAAEEEEVDGSTTSTIAFPNEKIVAVIDEADYEEGDDIPYSPSEAVYKELLDITEKDYGKPYIVEEDEAYYLVVRYDLADRVTEDDLWTENQIYNVQLTMFNEDFEAYIQEWSDALSVTRNEAAYKRYNPFKFDFS